MKERKIIYTIHEHIMVWFPLKVPHADTITQLVVNPIHIPEEFRNLDKGLKPGQKWQFFVGKKRSMEKENVSCSVMYLKKGLRMITLCNLHYEKTMQIAAQQTQDFLCSGTVYMRIRWRSCKVCFAKKRPIQCNILKYLRKTKESAITQAPLKDSNAIISR